MCVKIKGFCGICPKTFESDCSRLDSDWESVFNNELILTMR